MATLFDGNYSTPQIAGPTEWEIPFKTDPKPYAYTIPYWVFQDDYESLTIGEPGPFGVSYFVGDSSPKPIGGGVIEIKREFALVPDQRNEYETFVYGYHMQFFTLGLPNVCTDTFPLTVNSRVQFDYFRTDDPSTIDLPGAPSFQTTCLGIISLNGAIGIYTGGGDVLELLAEDSQLKIWKPGIYERRQRYVKPPSTVELLA